MRVCAFHYYAGPNFHCLKPVAQADVDLEEDAETRTDRVAGFTTSLLDVLPGLSTHHCSLGFPGGFKVRLEEGTYIGHVAEHVALELLHLSGEEGTYGKTRTIVGTRVRIVFEAETKRSAWRALEESLAGVSLLAHQHAWPIGERLADLRDEWAGYRLGPSTRAIVEAARRRGIPVTRLDDDSLVSLGYGRYRQLIQGALTSRTSAIAVERAQDKNATRQALRAAGLPVPDGVVIHRPEEAAPFLDAVIDAGGSVVVKPIGGRHGDGVTMDVRDAGTLARAWQDAGGETDPVLVERQVAGAAIRLLVVNGKLAAAARRIPPEVTGDGLHTVRELIDALNRDPRRGGGHHFPLTRVPIDRRLEGTLAQRGLSLTSRPRAGQTVPLLAAANLSTGAVARDVTEEVGAALAQDAVRAAATMGLDVAGVDVVTRDMGSGLDQVGGVVLEVNAMPGIRMHEHPSVGTPRHVGEAILDYLFPPGTPTRVPVVAVTGTNGKTTVTRMVAAMFRISGSLVGMATTDGIWIGDARIGHGDWTGPWSAQLVLQDAAVEAAVLETARGGLARGGLGFDACDVGVVTNIGMDHLGQDGIETLEDLVHLKALVVETVRPDGAAVLNADDPRVLGMRRRTRGSVVLFSLKDKRANGTVGRHLAMGGRAVYLRRDVLMWADGTRETPLVAAYALPCALGGKARVNVANAAAAAAAGLSLGLPVSTVREALRTFPAGGGAPWNRGRLEVVEGADVTVLIDYAHNAPAVRALGDICRSLRPGARIITVLGLPGDRRDVDLAATARAVGRFADDVVVREDADRRGRRPGVVALLLERTLLAEGLRPASVSIVLDESEAVKHAVADAPPGSLVLVLYEDYERVRDAVSDALAARGAATSDARIPIATGIG